MTDKEKILTKIESLLNETNYESFSDEIFGRIQTLKELKSYIDSLKEEPKFKIGDIIRFKGNETLEGEEKTHKIVGYDNELYIFDDGTTDLFCEQELYELVKEPVSEDLK